MAKKGTDWDLLILTKKEYPKSKKWELQDKLLEVTMKDGARVNVLLVQKSKWESGEEWEAMRKKIEGELVELK